MGSNLYKGKKNKKNQSVSKTDRERKISASEQGKNVEINTGGLNEHKEIDLDRGHIEISPGQEQQLDQQQQQNLRGKETSAGKKNKSKNWKDYSSNTPDIDEETLKYGRSRETRGKGEK